MFKLRVYGTRAECATAVALLKRTLVVWKVSRPYDNTQPGTVRVYVDVDLPGGTGEKS